MIIDAHGHVTAPDKLYVYKAGIISHRGAHGRGSSGATDDDVKHALNEPVFGGSSHLDQLKEVGTDMQLVSPRPYQMMHSENPKLVNWFMEETNNIIARQTKLYPNVFRGVCGLPQSPGVSPKNCLPELERCVKQLGFVGCLINPDPGEASGMRLRRWGTATGIRCMKSWSSWISRAISIRRDAARTGSPIRFISSTKRALRWCRW